MSDRSAFNHKAEEILNFIETYLFIKREQLEIFFPNSNKIVDYLIKHKRLHNCNEGIYITIDTDLRFDKAMIAAVSVLGELFEKVKTHTKATSPVQISFITHRGDYYEIIYVGYGMESMVTETFKALHNERQQINDFDNTKRIIIIEDNKQMERLQIRGTVRYAHIQPDGSLIYYKNGS